MSVNQDVVILSPFGNICKLMNIANEDVVKYMFYLTLVTLTSQGDAL